MIKDKGEYFFVHGSFSARFEFRGLPRGWMEIHLTHLINPNPAGSDLKHVAIAGYHFIQDGVHEETQ
jgi:hypothetical protein